MNWRRTDRHPGSESGRVGRGAGLLGGSWLEKALNLLSIRVSMSTISSFSLRFRQSVWRSRHHCEKNERWHEKHHKRGLVYATHAQGKLLCAGNRLNAATTLLLRSESPSWAASAQSFALRQQATIEFTYHDRSPLTLVITFNRSHVSIDRDYTTRSLYYCLFTPHACGC